MMSEASFKAFDDFCSPSAAITCSLIMKRKRKKHHKEEKKIIIITTIVTTITIITTSIITLALASLAASASAAMALWRLCGNLTSFTCFCNEVNKEFIEIASNQKKFHFPNHFHLLFPFSKPQLSRRGFPTHLWRRPSETRSPEKKC